ncbi:MAG: class I SAM-dependent methyltransferase [Bdellovibrionales bacterium]
MNNFLYTPNEIYLKEFHKKYPGCTSYTRTLLAEGSLFTSYDLITELIPQSRVPLSLLDLACGDGYLLQKIQQKNHENIKLYGIDMSEEELHRAQKRFTGTSVEFKYGKVQSLPYQDETFDFITCHMALMLMDELETCLSEIKRVLKKGGLFVSVIPKFDNPSAPRLIYRNLIRPALVESGNQDRLANLGDPRLSSQNTIANLMNGFFKTTEVKINTVEQIKTLDNAVKYYLIHYGPDLLTADKRLELEINLKQELSKIQTVDGFIDCSAEYFTIIGKS